MCAPLSFPLAPVSYIYPLRKLSVYNNRIPYEVSLGNSSFCYSFHRNEKSMNINIFYQIWLASWVKEELTKSWRINIRNSLSLGSVVNAEEALQRWYHACRQSKISTRADVFAL
jgi:hypothetical protein